MILAHKSSCAHKLLGATVTTKNIKEQNRQDFKGPSKTLQRTRNQKDESKEHTVYKVFVGSPTLLQLSPNRLILNITLIKST